MSANVDEADEQASHYEDNHDIVDGRVIYDLGRGTVYGNTRRRCLEVST